MRSFILQPDFDEEMKKIGKRNYLEVQAELNKLDNGMETLLTENQKEKYNLK